MIKTKKILFFVLALSMATIVALSNYLVKFPVNYFGLQDLLTFGAFSYPLAFLITDLSNRKYGKDTAKKIVYIGFALGVFLTLLFSTNFVDLISIKRWFVAPITSSFVGSTIDTFLFFLISFYGTSIHWLTLSLGDLAVKLLVAVLMLIPFRIFIFYIKEDLNGKNKISA